ncbi:SDR family NAD(P)-dependent oxidoreductase [Psychromonas sp. KJ10-10]|uniref:SDR family NAD(P)-dependent oxidoreductase n=1 Tax=Psychromonas sp. KJ10-10 TaxID=3391823 RepID=UPI0039B3E477
MKNTVLVTGASAGLGEEFSWQLGALGYNLLLVARRIDNLALLKTQLSEKYPQQEFLICSVDLNDVNAISEIQALIEKQHIQLIGLINNAGFGARGEFCHLSAVRQQQMLQVNIVALTELTHHAIDHLNNKKDSFIINVASTVCFSSGAKSCYILCF